LPQETEPAAPTGARERGRVSVRALLLLGAVALALYGLDQLAKYLVVTHLVEGQLVPVLGQLLQLHYVTNSGAAFSLASGFTWILSIVAVGVVVFIVWFSRRIRSRSPTVVLSPGELLPRECGRGARSLYLLGERMPETRRTRRRQRTCEEQQ